MIAATSVIVAYLLGSLSFSYLIVRALSGVDIRTVGSGNAGATNVLRVAGKGPALAALVLDAGKGIAAVLVARWLDAGPATVALVGLAAVIGHMAPVFFGFRGGKGVATAAGTLGILAPTATLLALVLFVLVVAVSRYVSLGSVVVALAHPWLILLLSRLRPGADALDPWLVFSSISIGLLVVTKHRANLARLMSGTEKRLAEKASTP